MAGLSANVKHGQAVLLSGGISVRLVGTRRGVATLRVDAPDGVRILRESIATDEDRRSMGHEPREEA